ncbi:MAG: ATP-binding cassette domain-containing protein [Clostridiales bacterium]|jgi:cobalt/nickel transport system ATP-binding protein|nr:ATP-binding cassette domain-containing protein [Clostridiales bacterium]
MRELLKTERLCFQYEERYPALSGVSAAFHAGERIAVLGGNGAGKSTFFLCCNGVLRPQSGKIFWKGQEITNAKQDVTLLRQSVGLVFQDPDSQIIAGTVEQEVSFGPMNLRLSQEEVIDRVDQSLRKMNLEGYERRAPHYLSGGEKKRVSVADILAMKPEMILLDEPTASLDPENVSTLEHTLDDLSESGITLLVSTHDVDFAYRFASRAIVFSQGKILMDSAMDDAFASENILREAGLKKPLLYAAAEIIGQHFPSEAARRKPRSMEEFQEYIQQVSL